MKIQCKRCGKEPHELREYITLAKELQCTPEQAVVREEGTYNRGTGKFYCTVCYVAVGMPLGRA